MRISPLALVAGLLLTGGGALAQTALPLPPSPALQPSRVLQPLPSGDAAARLPIILDANQIEARPERDASAEGDVQFRRGGVAIRADRLSYEMADDLAVARGKVRIRNEGNVYSGSELRLHVQRFEGFFLQPEFEFEKIGAGGRADRVEFIDSARSRAYNAQFTSCPRDGPGEPDWLLKADRVSLDFDSNEGVAEGAVLRFLGVPIIAMPALSFPLTDDRKSGWLPPTLNVDSRSGVEVSVPYYWNIAPNRDATLVPRVLTKRGLGLQGEFRYLEPAYGGTLGVDLIPNDRVADRSRQAFQWEHQGELGLGLRYWSDVARVSDDDWWKDFPDGPRSLSPRLLAQRAGIERPFDLPGGGGLAYARVNQWQVLQGGETPISSPYQRSPQIGLRMDGRHGSGFEATMESEGNQFTLPSAQRDDGRLTGWRWHAKGAVSAPWRRPGVWVVPRLALQAVSYQLDQPMADGRRDASRVIPTLSVDSGLEFERETEGFGRALRQTLEPRLLYVNTPYREQSGLPNFDSAGKDFNFSSIYSENAFSGVDRVSDSHQITAGVTTRLLDAASGLEALRLGLVQRYLLRDQLVTAKTDGTVDGAPLEQRFSDLLLLGGTSVLPGWSLDAALQYSPDISRPVRSVLSARYSPGPYRTIGTTYRLARELSEQIEVGWQWPIWGGGEATPAARAAASSAAAATPNRSSACSGRWYSVGRVSYNLLDSRVTDTVLGFEYDAGCWIGRVVAEQLSTGRSEATTRLLLQLELVGLSRIGSNPLKVLKENIPGYRLLRDEPRGSSDTPLYD
jgi:LPS-assembly protein